MIVEIFLVLIGIAVLAIVYGEVTKELSWAVVGFSIVFILSGWVLFGYYTGKDTAGLEFRSGSTMNMSDPSNVVVSYTYTSYGDDSTFWIGLFLTIMSGLGLLLVAMPRNNVNTSRRRV